MESDETSYSDYLEACHRLAAVAEEMSESRPDEVAEHYLPIATRQFALIFNFIGANATMRHASRLHHTIAALEAAKDRASSPRQENHEHE